MRQSLPVIHLLHTFYGSKLLPRDRDLKKRMQEVSPVITRGTTLGLWFTTVSVTAKLLPLAAVGGGLFSPPIATRLRVSRSRATFKPGIPRTAAALAS